MQRRVDHERASPSPGRLSKSNDAVLKNTSPHNYALFMAARDLCDKTEAVTMADLAEPEVIDPEALRLIVNATLIARYGLTAFQIKAWGAEYER